MLISPKEVKWIMKKDQQQELKPTAGWIDSFICELAKDLNLINLSVVFPTSYVEYYEKKIEDVNCYALENVYQFTRYTKKHLEILKKAIDIEKPDIIIIFGSEYTYQYEIIQICKELNCIDNVAVWIQGLVGIYSDYYTGNLPYRVQIRMTLKEILGRSYNIAMGKKNFYKRGKYECELFNTVSHAVGRTDWDKACMNKINPSIQYHFCNELLRPVFYEKKWNINTCEKYSIFVSQNHYPLKGYHVVLEAVSQLKGTFPNIKLVTTGRNVLSNKPEVYIRFSSYDLYLRKLIKKFNLCDNVVFTGPLNEQKMCNQFLKAHVFVSAAFIENSPNSLGEAMILGVPTISSDVGGVKNMLEHNKDGYIYQSDAPYMLAYYIQKLFEHDEIALTFSKNARVHAMKTHNKDSIMQDFFSMCEKVSESGER